ncbi:MAG: hypothetical protein AAF560_31565 [Acidobacteriota bacterium]
MAKRPKLEDRLAELSALRSEPDPAISRAALAKALANRNPYLVGKAAKIAAELGHDELEEALTTAFDRFMVNPVRTDKGCVAKIAIVQALVELDARAEDTYLLGIRHRQFEPSYGEPVDTAVPLRAASAEGLLVARHPELALELTELLVDRETQARLAAARVLAASGLLEAESLLRLKVHLGDAEPEITTEAMLGLLTLAPRRSLPFAERFLDHDDPATVESAALALGESRLEGAVELLERRYQRCVEHRLQQTLLLCISMLRREAGFKMLLELVRSGSIARASQALTALAVHRDNASLRDRVEAAVAEHSDAAELETIFVDAFR